MNGYMWVENPRTNKVDLVAIIDKKRHHVVTGIDEYERAIKDNPYLIVSYDLNNPKDLRIIHKAVKEINNSQNKTMEFKKQLFELGVKPTTLQEWMTMDMMQYDEPRDDIVYLRKKNTSAKSKTKRACRCKNANKK
jgi:hypothetical protein